MMATAKWHIPMVLSGHGREQVGIILWRRLRVWWKPAPCYDKDYVPVRRRSLCTIGGRVCQSEREVISLRAQLASSDAALESVCEDKYRIAQQRDKIYRAYREACKRSGEHPMTRETFL